MEVYLFACIEKNIGDDLFIYAVTSRYPNANFIISSSADYLKINNISNLKYSNKLRLWLKFANNESNNIIKRVIKTILEKIFRIPLKKLNSIYIVGNAFKNNNYKGHYQINWILNRIKLSKKFFLISTNYGPANSDNWRIDCNKAFSKMTDVCFRDIKSYELFGNLKNVRYAPDAVLSIKINNKKGQPKDYIIISIIDCSFNDRSNSLKQCAQKYEEKMVEIINGMSNIGTKIILLNSNMNQDEPASIRIYDKCKNKNMIFIYNYDGNIKKIFDLYSGAKAIIATRLHTIILGWLYNIPVIPIIYDIKVENLLNSYEFNSTALKIDDLKNLNPILINRIINDYSFKLSKKIIEGSNNQFKEIDKLLK